ncbi:MAG: hypothetical protein IPO08_21660 [Xanthomonadales bacterium]|nr:hypothetical protein [Xanthomonadales bacterium]
MSRRRDTQPERVRVTLASPQDITVDVPGLVSFRLFGPRVFPRAAAVFVDAELMADAIVLSGRATRQTGPAGSGPVHSESPNRVNGGAL